MWSSSTGRPRRRLPAASMIVMAAAMAATLSGAPAEASPGSPAGPPSTHPGSTAPVGAVATIVPPTQIGTARDWSDVTISGTMTCGVRTDGSLWCWEHGSTTPKRIGGDTRWSTVAAGWGGTCGIDVNGGLWCWDRNSAGWDGTGMVPPGDPLVPARVGAPGGWAAVAVGGRHSCAVRTDGSLWCWGVRDDGQVGNGNDAPPCNIYPPIACPNYAPDPVQVGIGARWASVSAGHDHTCATQTNGTLWCWGSNALGQMGSGKHECYFLPWPVGRTCPPGSGPQLEPGQVGTATNWTQVMAGDYFNCGLRNTGALWCWGNNEYGQLGAITDEQQGNRGVQLTPIPVEAASNWAEVATGDFFICAIRTDRGLWCWGHNEYGQVGTGSGGPPSRPVQVGPGSRWKKVAARYSRSCAIRADGTLWCWGDTAPPPQ